jgi:RNA polymerase sigma-70 factor, ECF subfamily
VTAPHHEQQIIQAAQQNRQALYPLYQQYFPLLYAYAAARIGRASDAEDVVATIWVKVMTGLEHFQYRGEGSFRAWLFRIAYHCITDYFRAQRVEHWLPLEDLPEIASHELPPDEALHLKERFQHLRTRIQTLSPRRQEVLTLKFYGGLRNNEIAAILELDERTVAAHLCRAIEDLQRQYQQEVDTP